MSLRLVGPESGPGESQAYGPSLKNLWSCLNIYLKAKWVLPHVSTGTFPFKQNFSFSNPSMILSPPLSLFSSILGPLLHEFYWSQQPNSLLISSNFTSALLLFHIPGIIFQNTSITSMTSSWVVTSGLGQRLKLHWCNKNGHTYFECRQFIFQVSIAPDKIGKTPRAITDLPPHPHNFRILT